MSKKLDKDTSLLIGEFLSGMLSCMKFGSIPMDNFGTIDIAVYTNTVRNDLNLAYKQLTKKYERN